MREIRNPRIRVILQNLGLLYRDDGRWGIGSLVLETPRSTELREKQAKATKPDDDTNPS